MGSRFSINSTLYTVHIAKRMRCTASISKRYVGGSQTPLLAHSSGSPDQYSQLHILEYFWTSIDVLRVEFVVRSKTLHWNQDTILFAECRHHLHAYCRRPPQTYMVPIKRHRMLLKCHTCKPARLICACTVYRPPYGLYCTLSIFPPTVDHRLKAIWASSVKCIITTTIGKQQLSGV